MEKFIGQEESREQGLGPPVPWGGVVSGDVWSLLRLSASSILLVPDPTQEKQSEWIFFPCLSSPSFQSIH